MMLRNKQLLPYKHMFFPTPLQLKVFTFISLILYKFLVGEWLVISGDSCGKTEQARPHRLSCHRQMSRGGLSFIRGKRKK